MVHGGLTPFIRHELQSINTESISDWAHESPSGRQVHASTNAPKPCRPTNYNADCTGNEAMAKTKAPAPHQCAPRGGHRYKPRPEPRRHHLTHAAGMGHTSPQRRHQHKAPCIVPLPGAAAATHNTPQTKATLPCINLRYKAGWLYFLLRQKLNQDRMDEI